MEGIVVNHLVDPQLLQTVLARGPCHVTDPLQRRLPDQVESQQDEKWHVTHDLAHHHILTIKKKRTTFQRLY